MTGKDYKQEFDLFPFCWKCTACGKMIPPSCKFISEKDIYKTFQDVINVDELNKIPILARNYRAQETIKNMFKGEKSAIILSIKGQCPICNMPSTLAIWVELELYHKEDEYLTLSVNHYEILDGDYIQLGSIPGFYRGVDIASGLNNLFLRWFYLNGEIYVICPFINKEELEYFDKIGRRILITNSSLGNPKYYTNPFKKIITRRYTGSGKDRTTMTELIGKYLKGLNGDTCFIEGNPGSGIIFIMTGSLTEVENKPRRELQDHHQYANYFHAKFYGGLLNDTAEIVITSYNYTVPEILQLESLAFLEISKDDFKHQIAKFVKDIHMTLHPVNLSKIISPS